jgi:chlorophyllide a oxygenase
VAEQPLKEFWFPAEFSSQLDSKTLVPFELFDEPWVLFRWAPSRVVGLRG